MEAASTWGGGGGPAIAKAAGGPAWDTAVRGYRTEMEHFAYCVRKWQELKQPVSYEKEGRQVRSTRTSCRAATARSRWPTPSSR